MVTPFLPDPEKVAAIRSQLPATGAGIYLNAGTTGPLPAETARAMEELAARELAVGRAHPDQRLEIEERMAVARASVAAVLVADPDDVALTHSTTDGMNLAVSALPWRDGDRVVTTRHEHAGGLGPLLALRARSGVEVVQVDIGDGGDDQRTLDAVEAAVDPRTRAVALSHVLWTTGAVLPIRQIATLASARGVRTIVDGAQAAGAIPVAVEELGVDAYALPAQKWLLGPVGMGALWIDRRLADSVTPAVAGHLSYSTFELDGRARLRDGARRFEASNFHDPSILGFARSLGWLSMSVGLPWAMDRATRLAGLAADRLAMIPGVDLVTPRPRMATIVTFRIRGWPSGSAVTELGARVFAIMRSLPSLDALRISVGFWTTEEELERFAVAVELLARHSPETLPSRRLALLGDDLGRGA